MPMEWSEWRGPQKTVVMMMEGNLEYMKALAMVIKWNACE